MENDIFIIIASLKLLLILINTKNKQDAKSCLFFFGLAKEHSQQIQRPAYAKLATIWLKPYGLAPEILREGQDAFLHPLTIRLFNLKELFAYLAEVCEVICPKGKFLCTFNCIYFEKFSDVHNIFLFL